MPAPDGKSFNLRKFECEELAGVRRAADCNQDVLAVVVKVCHRRSGLRRRHVNRARVLPGRLVVGAQHRAALSVRRRHEPALAGDHQVLGHEHADASRTAGARNLEALEIPRTGRPGRDRKSTRLNSSHANISYAVFFLKKKKTTLGWTVIWQACC